MRDVQELHDMPDLLDAEQVGHLLRIDRSTVYRMAESGRLPAAKVGRQWRFRAVDVRQLLDLEPEATPLDPAETLQPLLELAARLLGVMLVVTDLHGRPMTKVANPCDWFRRHRQDADVVAACAREWAGLADGPDLAPQWRTGPLGFDCARAFVRSGDRLLGMVLAGGVGHDDSDTRALHHLDAAARARVLETLPSVAAAVSRITSDRSIG